MTAACCKTDDERSQNADSVCDIAVLLPADFRLQSGEKLSRPEIRLRLYGDPAKPVIVAAGGISAGRAIADWRDETGWWREIVHAGGAIDLNKFAVVGFDFLPNSGETARTITSRDQAQALAFALSAAKIERVRAFVGASYGGMAALAFGEEFAGRVEKLCIISAADRAHPAATALRGVQRRIVEFARAHGAAQEGVSLARQLAMVSYRTPEEFGERFSNAPGAAAGDPYDVCAYLIARGDAYGMAPERYVTLSDSIDRHTVDATKIETPTLCIASGSDRLVPVADVARLAGNLASGRYVELDSLYGHDAFLKETAIIGPAIKSFIEE